MRIVGGSLLGIDRFERPEYAFQEIPTTDELFSERSSSPESINQQSIGKGQQSRISDKLKRRTILLLVGLAIIVLIFTQQNPKLWPVILVGFVGGILYSIWQEKFRPGVIKETEDDFHISQLPFCMLIPMAIVGFILWIVWEYFLKGIFGESFEVISGFIVLFFTGFIAGVLLRSVLTWTLHRRSS